MDSLSRYLLHAAGCQAISPPEALSPSEWAALPARCVSERLLHIVGPGVAADPTAPEAVKATMGELLVRSVMQAMTVRHHLGEVMATLTGNKIEAVPLKGLTLSQRLYGDPMLRQAGDIDVLVTPADFSRARDCLMALGFAQSGPFEPDLDHHSLLRRNRGQQEIWVELHQAIKRNNRPYFPFSWWMDRRPIQLGADSYTIFTDEDLLLYLALHAAGHGYAAYGWLADIAQLINSGTIDRERLAARAAAAGLHKPLYHTLRLLRSLGAIDPGVELPLGSGNPDGGLLQALRPRPDHFRLLHALFVHAPRPSPRLARVTAFLATGERTHGQSRDWLLPSLRAFKRANHDLPAGTSWLLYPLWLARGISRASLEAARIAWMPGRR